MNAQRYSDIQPSHTKDYALNVLLVDDHQIYLDGLSITLSMMSNIDQVYQATCLEEAMPVLASTKIDIILLDLNLPQVDGFNVMKRVSKTTPDVPVLILSGSDQPEDMRLAMSFGAKGYLNKTATGDEITDAITRISQGEQLNTAISIAFVNDDAPLLNSIRQSAAREYRITQRQAEVLVLLSEGLSNKLICRRLNLTEATVKFHLKALFIALDVHNRTECVAVARKLGVLV